MFLAFSWLLAWDVPHVYFLNFLLDQYRPNIPFIPPEMFILCPLLFVRVIIDLPTQVHCPIYACSWSLADRSVGTGVCSL